ncbi:hypothetical protein ACEQ8H_005328 [Pleosporales sp. CAS-2024a]
MTSKYRNEPVAIVGSSCRFPGGANSPSSLWKLLEHPRDVCMEIPKERFDTTTFYHPDGSHHGTTNVRQSYLLEEDVRVFDAAFFNISPHEADSIDPQQRLLLETVYEALESGGHTVEALKGSDTAVYAGTMTADFNETLTRDHNTMPTYFATGTNRAIISNRVSYFFDWHGPSMTIDTACSSSLIAVHQGMKTLRTSESRVVVAAGTQVILNPEMYINESKLKMLSPTGRSRMWDADADGYARGEGVAVVVMKLLSDAMADGDHIECIIRETGANQDGFSNGLTVPNTDAQAALIRQTYRNAGLDPEHNATDRPQFFEAHGTGTQAGDPKEAAAIYQSFGKYIDAADDPLYVGSVKTVIGHLEGAAGLAGILKASAMIQAGYMAPNLLFERLNPRIEPFYKGLRVSTELRQWPSLPTGVPRRVSVNSFGFGGANAHAILEQYQVPEAIMGSDAQSETVVSPFVFSADSESSLRAQLQTFSEHLKTHGSQISAVDLAWTLQSRRSQLSYKTAIAALNNEQLAAKIDAKLVEVAEKPGTNVGARSTRATPSLLGVFTGQGAQWPAMGAQLIRSSAYVRNRLESLEQSLADLPEHHRPKWSLMEEMLAGADTSRISEAALSQPLCSAVQIVLVDLLRSAGIEFTAVVGHSSGEIGAAYAAGFLSDTDAMRTAYYRGLFARFAGNEATNQKGAMLAAGTSWEDAEELVNLRFFKGRLAVAAHNSPASVTLSGDADAIVHAKKVFDEEKKFARALKVDTAYHSHHMIPCGDVYVQALHDCGVKVITDRPANAPAWYSSVSGLDTPVEASDALAGVYWKDNMCNAVLFSEAVQNAVRNHAGINLAIEVGPHPALKGPAMQNIAEVRPSTFPYTGLLSRAKDDRESFSDGLGFVWALFPSLVDFETYEKTISGNTKLQRRLVTGLPKYQWDHSRVHWTESRISRRMRNRKTGPHEILGFQSPDSNPYDLRFLNVLKPTEISWLVGHQLQGQSVFPAAGYAAMAFEASRMLAGDKTVSLFELHNLTLPRAITFEEGDSNGVETLVALTAAQHSGKEITAEFACYSAPVVVTGSDHDMELMASGTVKIVLGNPDMEALSCTLAEDYNMATFDVDRFYTSLAKLGYGYHGPFRTMSSMKRRLNQSSVMVDSYAYTDADQSEYMIHPSTLDVAFQSSILAHSAPQDGRLWSLAVPTSIGVIRVNPSVCASQPLSGCSLPVCATLDGSSETFSGNIDIFSEGGEHGMVQIEDLAIKPFAPATKRDDRVMFTHTELGSYSPDGAAAVEGMRPSAFEVELSIACERISYHYIRQWKAQLQDFEWSANEDQPHWAYLFDWVNEMLTKASRNQHPTMKREWAQDSLEDIQALIAKYKDASIDVKLLEAVGENLPAAVRGQTTILEHMLPNNMLDDWYKKGLGFERYNTFLARMMKQLVHRYPHARILEIGAGTGGATKAVLESIGDDFSSYTYTDVSVGFFPKAAELFKQYSEKMTFKVFDAEKTPASQGYEQNLYDIIIASNVLHATESMQKTLENTRKLLRPGGYLMLLEITGQAPVRYHNVVGSVPGWWLGVNDGRKFSPLMTPGQWNSALRKAGFGGVDAVTPEIDGVAWPLSIIASQAVDERVNFLRRPLYAPKAASHVQLDSLVILGNQTLDTARLSEAVAEKLGRFSGETIILDGFPTEEEASTLNPSSTFVNLVDLEEPIFQNMSEEKMEGLKRMLELSKRVVWVTRDAQMDQPYHMSSVAFVRTLRQEETHLSLNSIDVSSHQHEDASATAIAEYLLRQSALDDWDAPPSVLATDIHRQFPLLWSKEYELFVGANGQWQIPRLVKNEGQNARLNSSRRALTKLLPIAESNIHVLPGADAQPPMVVEQVGGIEQSSQDSIATRSSTLSAISVNAGTFLFAGVGADKNGQLLVFAAATNASKVTPVASVPVPSSLEAYAGEGSLTVAVASELLASALFAQVPAGSHVLVHASRGDSALASALSRRAAAHNVRVTCLSASDPVGLQNDVAWVQLDANTPNYALRKRVRLLQATHFVDLHLDAGHAGLDVAHAVPRGTIHIDASTLFRANVSSSAVVGSETISRHLRDAVDRATPSSLDLITPLDALSSIKDQYAVSAISWPHDGLVQANVRPLNAQSLFSKDRTYLLVGLTGQLGQSLAEWMVANGAGCIVLTSRSPKIDQRWLDSFEGSGATVKTVAMDVLNVAGMKASVDDIRNTCPPIGGLANGAMLLEDSLFSNMSAASMNKVLGPKIDGSRNLDDIFHDEPLDFFILLSSVAYVVGNSGQSNYAAANAYFQGLARQRRRRGLAASVVDIGQVTGIGYIEAATDVVREQLKKFKLAPVSEIDLRQAFGETIQTGYPRPDEDQAAFPVVTVTVGIRTICDDEEVKGPWFVDPVFSHVITEPARSEADSGKKDSKTAIPLSQRLPKAANKEEALEILQEVFSNKLRTILQLGDKEIDTEASVVELGIDSLVAVEVRSWFLKEVKVDIPVLKIVGGASVLELCEKALEKLPKELEPAGTGESNTKVAAPAAPKAVAKPPPPPPPSQPQSVPSVSSPPPEPSLQDDRDEQSSNSSYTSASGEATDQPLATPATEISGMLTPNLKQDGQPVSNQARLELHKRLTSAAEMRRVIEKPKPAVRFLKSERISLPQSRFWYFRHLLEDQTAPNVAFSYHITGDMRVRDLEKAIRMVTTRHEALRTCFVGDDANPGEAFQKIMPSSPLRLEHKIVKSLDEVTVEFKKIQQHVFDLESGDVMRLMLLKLSSSDHYLLVNYHHIVMDGVSFQIFLSDIEQVYLGRSLGALPRQYPEVSAKQRRALENNEMSEELAYWRKVFPNGEQPPVLPLLPVARTSSRVAMKNMDTHQVGKWLDATVLARLKTVAKATRSTPFHLHLAAFKTMLFCLTGPETKDLTIGIADAARNDSNLERSIGFFLNLLTLRFHRKEDQSFSDAVVEARDTAYGALGSSRLPFDVLLSELNIERSSLHSPFFQAFLDYRQGTAAAQPWADGLQLAFHDLHPGRTAYDITLDVADNPEEVYIMMRVQTSLYDVTAANLLLDTYMHFLDVVTKDAAIALKDIPTFSEQQLRAAGTVGRGPELISDWPETLPHRIDQITVQKPDHDALVDGSGEKLTYSAMADRVEAIAETLQDAGVGAGSRVLVFQQPTVNWTCSMLAIMRIGAVYVPLDLRNPINRLATIAKDCEAAAVLTHGQTCDDAPQLQVAVVINVSTLPSKASAPIANRAQADEPAAILYTSGSTGNPKGIVVMHKGLRNEIEGYTKTWGLGAERVLQQSAMTFNHSSDQMYTGLVNGGMVYVVPAEKRGDPIEIAKIVQSQGITYTKATPSEYLLWLQYGRETLRQASSWRFAFGGGEQLTTTVTEAFASLGLPNLRFHNSYGPTEISISSHKMMIPYTDAKAVRDLGRLPCGYSLPNYHTYIVNDQLQAVPVGMPGEVCIGGAGVSLGYLNNKELTDHHFVPNTFATAEDIARGWTRMYRTGDIGYLREDGAMVFQNRVAGDTQVKIRGIRIELSDIESSIVAAAGGLLREAIVTIHENDMLVAHVVFAQQHDDVQDKDSLLDNLLSRLPLPQYMVPVVAIPVDKLPMNNHSKVDRKAVRAMPLPKRVEREETGVLEMSETMLQLKLVWRHTLGQHMHKLDSELTPSTDFFLAGGNSLLAIRLQAEIQKTFAVAVPLVKLLDSSKLGSMARLIEESIGSHSGIDWKDQSRPPVVPAFLADVRAKATSRLDSKKTILFTGATGFIARHVIPKLAARSDVAAIHCIAVRDKKRDTKPFTSPKVFYHSGDLMSPLLGLSEDKFRELASQVDTIVHMGSARGYFDNYLVLRPSNVHPTRELVKLSAPRHIPILFFSTIGVLPRSGAGTPTSAAPYAPASDGNDGYAATKWVSERILERSGADLHVPATIYRFAGSAPSPSREAKQQLLSELARLVTASGKKPDMKGWSGRVDFVPVDDLSTDLVQAVVGSNLSSSHPLPATPTRFVHYQSPISIDAHELRAAVAADGVHGLDSVPLLKWFGYIKALGFDHLLTSQDTTVDTAGTGENVFESRR